MPQATLEQDLKQKTNSPDPATIARNLNRAKQNDSIRAEQNASQGADKRREELRRQTEDKNLSQEKRLDALRALEALEEEEQKKRPPSAVEKFGPTTTIPSPSEIETFAKPLMEKVPMEEPREEEGLAPIEKQDLGEPVKEKPPAKGGGPIPKEKGYFERTKPITEEAEEGAAGPAPAEAAQKATTRATEGPAAGEVGERESPAAEKEGGAPKKKGAPAPAEQASKINGAQMAGRNQALTGGVEGAIAEKAGEVSEVAGQAAKWYQRYKWLIWIGGIIVANWEIILGALALITIFGIVALIANYMINHPGKTFFEAMWCGGTQWLGGDGMSCLIKEATKAATEAAKEATSVK